MVKSIAKFIRAEEGAVLVLVGLALFMLLAAAGTALDTSRYLIARNKMVTALDTATIAAATVAQSEPNLNIIGQNYFDANFPPPAGAEPGFMNTTTNPVRITYDPATGLITGEVTGTIKNSFMQIFGFTDLQLRAYAEVAWERLANMEIVLTVDNSPSMCPRGYLTRTGTQTADADTPACVKFRAVRDAASSFLDILFDSGNIENAYVGIVPFSHNVNAGGRPTPPSFAWPKNDYNSSALEPMLSLTSSKAAAINTLSNLRTRYDQWTRVNVGTNAAWLMLRPDHRSNFSHESASLPGNFGTPGLNKVVVMMTDGENMTYGVCQPNDAICSSVNYQTNTPFPDGRNDNDDLSNRCDLMKQQDIIIYSVLFNVQESFVPASVPTIEKIFQDCATLPTAPFFHSVKCSGGNFDTACGRDLITAYETIAHSLRKIRLHK